MRRLRPHVLGIDDAPFEKGQSDEVPIVAVMMEGASLVEGVAVDRFAVDGEDATGFLAAWVSGLRWHAGLQAVVLGGVTLAGLGVVDIRALAERLETPILAVTRRDTARSELTGALRKAGLAHRLAIVERTPPARRMHDGLFVAAAGVEETEAERILRASLNKANLPEPLRVAHLIGAAMVKGQSRGRV
jgi:endonuclease V-like protein UPF0215 family